MIVAALSVHLAVILHSLFSDLHVLYLLRDGSLENADIPEYFTSVCSLPNTICENDNRQCLRCFLSQALFVPNSTPQDVTHTTFTSAPRLATLSGMPS